MSFVNEKEELNKRITISTINNDESININNNRSLSRNMFKFNYVIGKGGFGKVWQVLYKKTKELFALKEMSKRKILDKKSEKSVTNELLLLKKLNHPFIVNMHYAFQDNENLYLVIDFLSGGDLRFHCSRYRTFSEEQTRFFIACMILGLQNIHKNNIIHRDIKPENLVLDDKGYLRITDFGIARINKKDNRAETSGTMGYMSPEVMEGKNHSFSVDFFAMGVIGFEFMIGKRPFSGKNRKEIKEKMLRKKIKLKKYNINNGWSNESIDFMNKLLERKPEVRLGDQKGVIELKEHDWLKYYPWNELEKKELPAPFIPDQEDNYDKKYCEIEEVLTEKTKERYNKIYLSPKYKSAFKDFYFNIEIEKRQINNNGDINLNNKSNDDTQDNNSIKINNTENYENKYLDNTISTDDKNEKQNKIILNIRKILYKNNNPSENCNNCINEQNNINNFIKERIEENIGKNSKIDNSKNNINNKNLNRQNNKLHIKKINKKEILKPEIPYVNINSNPSPSISIKNIFVNYYNNSSPKNFNIIKNKYNNINAINNKNKIMTPQNKRIFNYNFKNYKNDLLLEKIKNNINYDSFSNTKKENNNFSPIGTPKQKYYLNKMNDNKSERNLQIKKVKNIFRGNMNNSPFINNKIKMKNKQGQIYNKNYFINKLIISNNNIINNNYSKFLEFKLKSANNIK